MTGQGGKEMRKTETAVNGGKKNQTWKLMKRNYCLYLFLVPAVVFIAIFCYAPMYGVLMAFQDYSPGKGIMGKPLGRHEVVSHFF